MITGPKRGQAKHHRSTKPKLSSKCEVSEKALWVTLITFHSSPVSFHIVASFRIRNSPQMTKSKGPFNSLLSLITSWISISYKGSCLNLLFSVLWSCFYLNPTNLGDFQFVFSFEFPFTDSLVLWTLTGPYLLFCLYHRTPLVHYPSSILISSCNYHLESLKSLLHIILLSFQRSPEISILILWDAAALTALGQWLQNLEYYEETNLTFYFKWGKPGNCELKIQPKVSSIQPAETLKWTLTFS